MDWDQILQAFRMPQRGYPVEAARAIFDDPVLYERTVEEFQRISTLPQELEDSMFHLHVMHLLAEKRDSRAFRPLLNIASLTNDQLDTALGDFLTESFKRCVAAVCDDETAIRAFIEDRRHSEWTRLVLVEAPTLPVFAGDKEAIPLLVWLEAQPDSINADAETLVMGGLAGAVAEIGGPEHLQTLKRWWDTGWLDPQTADWNWYETEISRTWAERCDRFNRYHEPYVSDAIGEMQKWHCFSDRFHDEQSRPRPERQPDRHDSTTFVRANPKIGRNDPCPCGSGKKYKKCCAA